MVVSSMSVNDASQCSCTICSTWRSVPAVSKVWMRRKVKNTLTNNISAYKLHQFQSSSPVPSMSPFQHSRILILYCYWLYYFFFFPLDSFKIYTSWWLRCLVWKLVQEALSPSPIISCETDSLEIFNKMFFHYHSNYIFTFIDNNPEEDFWSFCCKSAFTIRSKVFKKMSIKNIPQKL